MEYKKLKMTSSDGTEYGNCGELAPFKDSNGDNLYTGDVVRLIGTYCDDEKTICNTNGDIFVMGIKGSTPDYQKYGWEIYKEKSYRSMHEGDTIDGVIYKEVEPKEMTIDEIEKQLGYKIKIIN